MVLVALLHRQHSYLHYEHLLHGVADQEAECLIPLRRSGAIAHLRTEKELKEKLFLESAAVWLRQYSDQDEKRNCMFYFYALVLFNTTTVGHQS